MLNQQLLEMKLSGMWNPHNAWVKRAARETPPLQTRFAAAPFQPFVPRSDAPTDFPDNFPKVCVEFLP
jgi:hypothetical protein